MIIIRTSKFNNFTFFWFWSSFLCSHTRCLFSTCKQTTCWSSDSSWIYAIAIEVPSRVADKFPHCLRQQHRFVSSA